MKKININNNRFEDVLFHDKYYLIKTNDDILKVCFFSKELINNVNKVKQMNKDFAEFAKDIVKEAMYNNNNDLMCHLYSNKLYSASSYNFFDLRKISSNTKIRYLIDDNPEDSTMYFANPEMICNKCFLEEAIGEFELFEFKDYSGVEEFYKNQIDKF